MTVKSYVSLQKAYHSVFKIVKNYVKSLFVIDCLVGSKYKRVFLISVISNRMVVLFSGAHYPVGSYVMPELLTFCETVYNFATYYYYRFCFFLLVNSDMALFTVHQANQIPIINKVDVSDGNLLCIFI
jgi:hypothetical protein